MVTASVVDCVKGQQDMLKRTAKADNSARICPLCGGIVRGKECSCNALSKID